MAGVKTTNVMAWVGRRREKRILRMAERHMEKVVASVEALRDTVYAFCDGRREDVERGYREVFRLEREADDVKRSILNELSRDVFHPIDRDEITRLLLTMDDIASNAKGASVRITFMDFPVEDEEVLRGLREVADRLVEIAREAYRALRELVESPSKALDAANRVEELEEGIDDVRRGLLRRLIAIGDSLGPSRLVCLKDVVDSMENVADRCEDTADLIRSLAILA